MKTRVCAVMFEELCFGRLFGSCCEEYVEHKEVLEVLFKGWWKDTVGGGRG